MPISLGVFTQRFGKINGALSDFKLRSGVRKKQMARETVIVDLFCGAGGLTTGTILACDDLGLLKRRIVAVDHWDVAIQTHSHNHPEVVHACAKVGEANPNVLVPGGYVTLLTGAPECTFHSKAAGGRPMNDQSRSMPWDINHWITRLDVESILIENVPEFLDWGPLYADDYPVTKLRRRPIPEKKGQYFEAWIKSLRALGYKLDWRLLRAADYGAATTRQRFFMIGRKGVRSKICWPEPTHAKPTTVPILDLDTRKPWRPVKEVIRWDVPGQSIYSRVANGKRPLVPNTMARIVAGLRKFSNLTVITREDVGQLSPIEAISDIALHPFVVVMRNNCDASSIDDPIPTICAEARHFWLAQPYIVEYHNGRDGSRRVKPIDEPIRTVDTSNRFALAQPMIVTCGGAEGQGRNASGVDEPLRTVLTENHMALVNPLIVPVTHAGDGSRAHSVDSPIPTITGARGGEFALIEPLIVNNRANDGYFRGCRVDEPMPAATCHNPLALAQFLVKFNRGCTATGVNEPMDTITTKERFALVSLELVPLFADKGTVIGYLDILLRMLMVEELAGATSFPKSYYFAGTKEQQVKQVGNSVPVELARALVRACLGPQLKGRKDTKR